MKNNKANFSTLSYLCAFIIGVMLFWALGKDWLDLSSALVFLAGLIGVAVAVLFIGAWNNFRHLGK
jgi:peptidoglycan/LPS O-acetylase OafA/YrhL